MWPTRYVAHSTNFENLFPSNKLHTKPSQPIRWVGICNNSRRWTQKSRRRDFFVFLSKRCRDLCLPHAARRARKQSRGLHGLRSAHRDRQRVRGDDRLAHGPRKKHQELWQFFDTFGRKGMRIRWQAIPRDSISFNQFADEVAGPCRLLSRDGSFQNPPGFAASSPGDVPMVQREFPEMEPQD